MTSATDLLLVAYGIAMSNDEGLHKRWISVSHKLGSIIGITHLIALQRNGRLDLMLRLLERERLKRMQNTPSSEPVWSLDLQISLSENWLLSAYEVARAAKVYFGSRSGENCSELLKLEHRLALVRMPVAKGEIQGMNKRVNKDNPPVLMRVGGDTPEPYQNNGSYRAPYGLCPETGAVVWYPVDMTTRKTVDICRRDLSDEMLALFD